MKKIKDLFKKLFSKKYRDEKYIESLDFSMFGTTGAAPKKANEEDKIYTRAYFKMRTHCLRNGKAHLLNLKSNL